MRAIKYLEKNSQLTDEEIVRRVIAGEKKLFELLLRRNNQKIFRVIRGYINQSDEIEDVMQDTYLKAYEKLYQYKHQSEFSTWLIRIAINEALGRLRKKGKLHQVETIGEQSKLNHIISVNETQEMSPEKLMIQKEGKILIEKLIDLLEPKYKVVFIMKEVEGMNIQEIANCLDLTKSNVKVRLHRARTFLKDKILETQLNKNIFEFGSTSCDKIVERVMNLI